MLEFKYDTQLLIDGKGLNEDNINAYIAAHFKGDCLLVVGDDDMIKLHFHTNEPWRILEYCATLGEIYDIVIEDNGPGIKDENRNRLFTPNFTTKSSGTGLGLAICKNILERCGGEIFYGRSFVLKGACFTVRYPKNMK